MIVLHTRFCTPYHSWIEDLKDTRNVADEEVVYQIPLWLVFGYTIEELKKELAVYTDSIGG